MRLVHWSDLHLGYQRFSRRSPEGVNQREFDVLKTFEEVVIKTAQLKPDLVVISGDMFDSPKPSNYTLKRTMQILSRIRDIRIVAIPGNHDRPKRQESVSPIELCSVFGNFFPVTNNTFLVFDDIKVVVACCVNPDELQTLIQNLPEKPRYKKILLVHVLLVSFKNDSLNTTSKGAALLDLIKTIDFDYVALGDLHTFLKVTDRAFYAGSSDYVSTNFWEETSIPKRFICVDFYRDELKVKPIDLLSPRPVVNLEPIDCAVLSDQEFLDVLEIKLTSQDLRESMVRLTLINPSPRQIAHLSSSKVKKLRSDVFILDLVIERHQTEDRSQPDLMYFRQSIQDELASFLNEKNVPEATKSRLLEEFNTFIKAPNPSAS